MGGGTAEAGASHGAAGVLLVPGSLVVLHAAIATEQLSNQATLFTLFSFSPDRG
jgi:hypothetical protein